MESPPQVVVLLGPPGSGKSAVGAALAELGLRWTDRERELLERWGSLEAFVANKTEALRALHDELRRQGEGSGTVGALARQALEMLPSRLPRATAFAARVADQVRRRASHAPRLDPRRVAFRTYIIGKMQTLLAQDARSLR